MPRLEPRREARALRRDPLTLALALALAAAPADGASLVGRVRVDPGFRPPGPSATSGDDSTCGVRTQRTRALVIGPEGGLEGCVVEVLVPGARSRPTSGTAPVLDNRACAFLPRIQVARVGEPLTLRNSDPVLHNVHAHSFWGHYSRFNVALPPGLPDVAQPLRRAEPLILRCDAGHPWMRAFVWVAEGPFATLTDARGDFKIPDLPPGRWEVRVWHEVFDRTDLRVEVDPGTTHLDLLARRTATPPFVRASEAELQPASGRSTPRVPPSTTAFPATVPRRRRAPGPSPLAAMAWVVGVLAAGALLLYLRRHGARTVEAAR